MDLKLKDYLGKNQLFFDGGTGTILQKMGLKPGELPETWNIKYPERITDLHYQYFSAGANIIKTDTFGAFITKFPLNLEKIITGAIQNANNARDKALANIPTPSSDISSITPTPPSDTDSSTLTNTNSAELPALFIAFDISSTGKLLKPIGDLDFEDCISLYKKTFRIAFLCKIDCVLIETMNDGYETKAAVIAAKEVMEELGVSFPILVTNVYDKDCRTLSGSTPESMVTMLEGLGVDALGVNCSLGPIDMLPTVERLCAASNIPVIINPNAGLPKVIDGNTVFDVSKDEFVKAMKKIATIPSRCEKILGGCCGTTPEYILAMKKAGLVQGGTSVPSGRTSVPSGRTSVPSGDTTTQITAISSNSQVVYFGGNNKTVLIGERINPTGKKKFKEALRNNDIPYIIHQGMEQEEAGAQVLDVNVGLPEIDEKQMMLEVMTELQSITTLPLQIDTTNKDVMETAIRRYNGKPMINSVNGKQEIMDQIFPIVKKYGGLVVALTLDENGIPQTSQERIKIAEKIYTEAKKYGISKKDIIIDPLAMAVSSDTNAAKATLETVQAIHQMGGLTSLGISNVSFGLPNREFVTSTFFTMAMQNGLSAAIMNPLQQEMQKAYHTFNLLQGKDANCSEYIDWSQKIIPAQIINKGGESLPLAPAGTVPPSATVPASATPSTGNQNLNENSNFKNNTQNSSIPVTPQNNEPGTLSYAIIHGLKQDAANATVELLKTIESIEIINKQLIPGLDYVGKRFEEKTMYLPQLLMAAEAAKSAFAEIRTYMEKSGKKGQTKGKIIIATVKGDIHDIGKNIVKVLLENYDFEVIDLGKDVPPELIVETCAKNHIMLVGLSALMTTTVVSMEETIKLLRKECPWTKVCVGGAVMTQEYADQIGADFYGKDAMDTVRYALKLFEK